MAKRGEVQSQVFVYILSLMILVLVLFFGYRAIVNLNQGSQQIDEANFEKQLLNDVSLILKDYGSEKIVYYSLPKNYREICFVDLQQSPTVSNHPLIQASLDQSIQKNIFLSGTNGIKSFYIESMSLPIPYFCIPLTEISLKLRSQDNNVQIGLAPEQKYCKLTDVSYSDTGISTSNIDSLVGEENFC